MPGGMAIDIDRGRHAGDMGRKVFDIDAQGGKGAAKALRADAGFID
jgi:hypothetical protein